MDGQIDQGRSDSPQRNGASAGGAWERVGDPESYDYSSFRAALFEDVGQRLFLRIRDATLVFGRRSGALRMREAIEGHGGSLWEKMACIDRMVEIGELVEVDQGRFSGLNRVFVVVEKGQRP